MYPSGHCRRPQGDLNGDLDVLLEEKFRRFGRVAFGDDDETSKALEMLAELPNLNADALARVYEFPALVTRSDVKI
jgi:hypothetical protein